MALPHRARASHYNFKLEMLALFGACIVTVPGTAGEGVNRSSCCHEKNLSSSSAAGSVTDFVRSNLYSAAFVAHCALT